MNRWMALPPATWCEKLYAEAHRGKREVRGGHYVAAQASERGRCHAHLQECALAPPTPTRRMRRVAPPRGVGLRSDGRGGLSPRSSTLFSANLGDFYFLGLVPLLRMMEGSASSRANVKNPKKLVGTQSLWITCARASSTKSGVPSAEMPPSSHSPNADFHKV
jgi:hypothetical protein